MSLEFSAQKWQMYRDQFYSAAFTIPDATHPVFSCQGCHWNLQKLSLPGHSWGNACSAQSCIRFQFSPRWSSAVADRISPLVCVQRSWKQQKLCLIGLLQEWALETEQKTFSSYRCAGGPSETENLPLYVWLSGQCVPSSLCVHVLFFT